MRRATVAALCGLLVLVGSFAGAGEAAAPAADPAPLPLPLHSIEGFGGVFLTETAYLVNAPVGDNLFGMPAIAINGTEIGDKYLVMTTATVNVARRFEIGFSYMHFDLGDWPGDVEDATGIGVDDDLSLTTLGVRALVIREGEGDTTWVPAVTVGVRYKKNSEIDDIDDDLLGTYGTLGYDDDDGFDITLMASKTFADILPKPFILSAGVRSTESVHAGLAGFTDDRDLVFEANAIFFILDNLVLAAEYRQMPDDIDRLGDLVREPEDWWSLALAYVASENLTLTAGFAKLGYILEEEDSMSFLGQIKWEF
ncbi:DUF3034 family protein [bacterium]|nr:DUF3034 family protein [bacterium]